MKIRIVLANTGFLQSIKTTPTKYPLQHKSYTFNPERSLNGFDGAIGVCEDIGRRIDYASLKIIPARIVRHALSKYMSINHQCLPFA
jgi:hypothetical protein